MSRIDHPRSLHYEAIRDVLAAFLALFAIVVSAFDLWPEFERTEHQVSWCQIANALSEEWICEGK
jgi:hypothetical protein